MKLIRARCGAQSGPSPRAERCSVWPKWNIDILSQNAASRTRFFSGTSHQNRSYLDNIWTNRRYIVSFQQGHCSREVTNENFKRTLQILQLLTPKFHSNSVSALCEGWLPCIASVMQGLLTPQNHRCKNRHSHFATISVSLTDSEKCCFKQLSRF